MGVVIGGRRADWPGLRAGRAAANQGLHGTAVGASGGAVPARKARGVGCAGQRDRGALQPVPNAHESELAAGASAPGCFSFLQRRPQGTLRAGGRPFAPLAARRHGPATRLQPPLCPHSRPGSGARHPLRERQLPGRYDDFGADFKEKKEVPPLCPGERAARANRTRGWGVGREPPTERKHVVTNASDKRTQTGGYERLKA